MVAKETTLNEIGETLAYVVEHMATKEDIARLDEHILDIERELSSIRRELNDLADKVENIAGYRKEIDYALERIAAIEKHLGLDKKLHA